MFPILCKTGQIYGALSVAPKYEIYLQKYNYFVLCKSILWITKCILWNVSIMWKGMMMLYANEEAASANQVLVYIEEKGSDWLQLLDLHTTTSLCMTSFCASQNVNILWFTECISWFTECILWFTEWVYKAQNNYILTNILYIYVQHLAPRSFHAPPEHP